MSLKKKAKCLLCRLLVKLGLKKACNAGPLPTATPAPKKTQTTKSKKTK